MQDDDESVVSDVSVREPVKCSPMLVPFKYLTEKEKSLSRKSAEETVKTMLRLGYDIVLTPGARLVNPGTVLQCYTPATTLPSWLQLLVLTWMCRAALCNACSCTHSQDLRVAVCAAATAQRAAALL